MEFTLEETFDTTPERLYNAWLDSDEHSDMTGGDAFITDEVEDKFTAWERYIWGENLDIKPYSYIKQSWMTSDFEEDQDYSIVEIKLEAVGEAQTKLVLRHSGLTDKDEHYRQGWIDNYFVPMKKYFSS